jgi:Putative Ig domain/FlgD Ig-like domain
MKSWLGTLALGLLLATPSVAQAECPVLDPIGDKTVTEGQLLTFTATATDADAGQTLTFSLINLIPAGAAIDPNTGVFTWTPTPDQGPGASDVTIQVTDNAAIPCVDSEIIHVTVLDAGGENQCPVLAPIGDRTVTEGQLLTFTATATDADAGQTLTFSLINLVPAGAAIDPNTGVFTWTPTPDQGPGASDVTIQVTDNAATPCVDSEIIHVTVLDAGGENQCPVVNPIAGQTIDEGQTVTFMVTATDPENETLVFALGPGAPAGAQIHPLSGLFTWTPTNDQSGTHTITIQVRDTCEDPCTVTATVTIVVNDSEPENQCPVLSPIGNQTVEEEVLLTFDANATDPDVGQMLTFSLDPGFPPGASINSSTGEFTFTPTHEQVGTHSVTVRVTDNGDPECSDFETITITVEEGENECPVLAAIGNRTVTEGELLTFTATATDPEGDEIIFSLDPGEPAGAMIHANTGVFTWTPTSEQGPGTYDITIRATDLCLTPCSDTETIQVTVLDVGGANACPVLAPIGDRTVTEGELLTFTATATDADQEEIIFSLENLVPAGAMIHANTGVFTWTPSPSQGPGGYDITIQATDLCDTPCSDSEIIHVTVLDTGGGGGDNECPVLAPIGDMTATQGENLAFTATATDPDPGQLTFSLVDAPSGATIHSVTGAFLWVPSSTGTFTFTVRVTDDAECSDEETIDVTVNPVGGGGASTVTAYFVGGNKTTKLWTGKKETCVQLEVMGDDEIDFSTIELVYNGQRIAAKGGERSRDRDRDGNPEGTVCFSKQELRTLFAGLPSGENLVTIQIAGRFESGESFTATVSHRIAVRGGNGNGNGHDDEAEDEEDDDVVAGNGNARMKAHAAPNPINPSTLLKFATTREGSVKVQVYDLSGRLVRTLHDGTLPAGNNAVAWDGSRSGGDRVSSGVYYFRIQSPDGQDVVRVTVLR